MSTETIAVLVAVVVAIVAGMFSPIAGRVAGLALAVGILGWGAWSLSQGRELAFFGYPLTPAVFYGILGALTVWEVVALGLAIRARRRSRLETCPACGSAEIEETEGKRACRRCQHTWP